MKILGGSFLQKQKVAFGSGIKNMYLIFKNSIVNVVLFELIYNIVLLIIIRPVLKLITNLFIKFSGYQILINEDISKFFLSVPGIIMGAIVLSISIVAVYYEFAVVILLLRSAYDGKAMKITEAAKKALYSFSSLLHISTLGFALYTLVIMPVMNFGISSSLFSYFEIPVFVIDEIVKYGILGYLLLIIVTISGVYVFAQAFFVIPIMVYEKKNFYKSFKKSRNIIKGNKFKIFTLSIIVMLIWMGFVLLSSILYSIFTLNMATLAFKVVFIFFILAIEFYTSPLFLSVLIVNYLPFEKSEKIDYSDKQVDGFINAFKKIGIYIKDKGLFFVKWIYNFLKKLYKEKAKPMIIATILIVAIIGGTIAVYLNAPMYIQTKLIVGHRGSKNGVENTTQAILSAAEQGADYSEIDILLSKDGVPMVIHDFSLLRLTGKSGNVFEYTKDELQENFIQSQNGYTARIETLDQVCKNVKGKIKLLVELKTHGKETQSVVEKTVEVIKNNNMEEDVLYQTTEYALLEQMKYRFPEVKMGYIIVGKVGTLSKTVLSKMPPDFYGIEQTMLTKDIIDACHKADKPIYVWTVNNTENVKEMFSMGVDGIITDYPLEIIKAKNILENSDLE